MQVDNSVCRILSDYFYPGQVKEVGDSSLEAVDLRNMIQQSYASMSGNAFDLLCLDHPNYNVRHCMRDGVDVASPLLSCIKDRNYRLLDHMINKFGKEVLLTSGIGNAFDDLMNEKYDPEFKKMILFLLSRGADINVNIDAYIYSHEQNGQKLFTFDTMIFCLDAPQNETRADCLDVVDFVVNLGAQSKFYISEAGLNVLRLKPDFYELGKALKGAIYEPLKQSIGSQVREKLEARKFEFVKASRREESIVSSLPKELIAKILTAGESGLDLRRVFRREIEKAGIRLMEKETLFLSAHHHDGASSLSKLPREIVQKILESGIESSKQS